MDKTNENVYKCVSGFVRRVISVINGSYIPAHDLLARVRRLNE